MPEIQVLDQKTADRIAAGEVITRPLAVVKELIENAVDAGGGRINIGLEEGGSRLISVQDDGCGMSSQGVRLAVQRHATSKIASARDLRGIATLGFRGEALPSVAAVARMEIVTRPQDGTAGTRLVLEGGSIRKQEKVGAPPGTKVTVRDLFYNTPARRKNLNTARTELARIGDLVKKMALAYPDIAFSLRHGKREIFSTPGRGRLREVLEAVMGRETVRQMLAVERSEGGRSLRGYVSRPELTRATARHQILFVNGRLVRSKLLPRVLREAYHTLIAKGRHPVAVIFLFLDPATFDVNIHPRKNEIRFYNAEGVRKFLHLAVKSVLRDKVLAAEMRFAEPDSPAKESRASAASTKQECSEPTAETPDRSESGEGDSVSPPRSAGGARYEQQEFVSRGRVREGDGVDRRPAAKKRELPQDSRSRCDIDERPAAHKAAADASHKVSPRKAEAGNIRLLGQSFALYIVAQAPSGLVIIDQHAAHERVIYERLVRSFNCREVSRQKLLIPVTLNLSDREFELFQNHKELLDRLGFACEYFGGNSLLVRTVPEVLGEKEEGGQERILYDIVDGLSEDSIPDAARLREEIIIFASCRAAVKAGQRLSREEMRRIVEALYSAEQPHTCPHGRPTVLELTNEELGRQFHRK